VDAGGCGPVVFLEWIGVQVIQLDHTGPRSRVSGRVRTKDRTLLDLARNFHSETGLKVADVLVVPSTDTAHRIVVAVKGLLSEYGVSRAVRLAPQQRQQ